MYCYCNIRYDILASFHLIIIIIIIIIMEITFYCEWVLIFWTKLQSQKITAVGKVDSLQRLFWNFGKYLFAFLFSKLGDQINTTLWYSGGGEFCLVN